MPRPKTTKDKVICSHCRMPFHGITACDVKVIDAQRFEALQTFLDSYDSRMMSRWQCADWPNRELRLYTINAYLIVVMIDADGWEIFLPAFKGNSIPETLEAVAAFLGHKPGDGAAATS